MAAHADKHGVNLPILFTLLLLFTAAEIVLYEVWLHTNFIPKFAMVLILLFVLTLPKAFIVMTYFMHLKFERMLLVLLALVPLTFVAILILPITVDIQTLASRNYTKAVRLSEYSVHGDAAGHSNHEQLHPEEADDATGAEPEAVEE